LASMVLLDMFEWWFARTGSVLGIWCKNCDVIALVQCWKCVCCFSWYPSPGRRLALLAAVVLPAQTLHAVTKLLELLVTRLDLIPLWPCCAFAWYPMALYPVMRTYTKLDYLYSMMQWQYNCQSLKYKL
jgi:hypothetical protein